MEIIYIPVRRLLRFTHTDSCQTVIAMERLLRQKQSPCLGGRLLRFARSDNRQTIIAMKRLRQWKRFAYRLGDCFASLALTSDGALAATGIKKEMASLARHTL